MRPAYEIAEQRVDEALAKCLDRAAACRDLDICNLLNSCEGRQSQKPADRVSSLLALLLKTQSHEALGQMLENLDGRTPIEKPSGDDAILWTLTSPQLTESPESRRDYVRPIRGPALRSRWVNEIDRQVLLSATPEQQIEILIEQKRTRGWDSWLPTFARISDGELAAFSSGLSPQQQMVLHEKASPREFLELSRLRKEPTAQPITPRDTRLDLLEPTLLEALLRGDESDEKKTREKIRDIEELTEDAFRLRVLSASPRPFDAEAACVYEERCKGRTFAEAAMALRVADRKTPEADTAEKRYAFALYLLNMPVPDFRAHVLDVRNADWVETFRRGTERTVAERWSKLGSPANRTAANTHLRYLEGKTQATIAEELGVEVSTVVRRIRRVRREVDNILRLAMSGSYESAMSLGMTRDDVHAFALRTGRIPVDGARLVSGTQRIENDLPLMGPRVSRLRLRSRHNE
jgi:hypothetical protein